MQQRSDLLDEVKGMPDSLKTLQSLASFAQEFQILELLDRYNIFVGVANSISSSAKKLYCGGCQKHKSRG